jgi:hypothetical protein
MRKTTVLASERLWVGYDQRDLLFEGSCRLLCEQTDIRECGETMENTFSFGRLMEDGGIRQLDLPFSFYGPGDLRRVFGEREGEG